MSKKKILFLILFIFIVLVTALVVYQYNNIKVVINVLKHSDEEISEMLSENKKSLQNELADKFPDVVGDFTEEEEKKIVKGEISVEEAIDIKQKEYEKTKTDTNNEKEKTNKIVNKKIIEFYSLKAYYLGQLGQIEASVIKDYNKLPKSKKNLVGKKEVASKYLSVATNLLHECDAKVDALLKELEGEIKKVNGDASVISTIKQAYQNEKDLKKAYYLSKLK